MRSGGFTGIASSPKRVRMSETVTRSTRFHCDRGRKYPIAPVARELHFFPTHRGFWNDSEGMITTPLSTAPSDLGTEPSLVDASKDYMAQADRRTGALAEAGKEKLKGALQEGGRLLKRDPYLRMALGSICLSLALRVAGRPQDAMFVGQWAPTILLFKLCFGSANNRGERLAPKRESCPEAA